jgi:hypothetical protein
VGIVLALFSHGFAYAAVDDPIDSWATADITRLQAQLTNGFLTIEVDVRYPPPSNPLDSTRPIIEIFLDTDQNPDTGDNRQGSVAGTDFLIECSYGILMDCTLHQPPYDRLQKEKYFSFDQIPGASTALQNDTLTINLPTNAIEGSDAVDVFAMAYAPSNNPITSHRTILGNGDRCPNTGVLDTKIGSAVIRRQGAPVDVAMTGVLNNSQGYYELTKAEFRTFGDQFEMTLLFNHPIDLESFNTLSGGVILDSDRSLMTGQLPMIHPQGLGYEIPSWGGDVKLSFDMRNWTTLEPSFLLHWGTTPVFPIPFGSRCEQESYRSMEKLPCNDGGWHVQDNQLIMTGSLSIFDALEIISYPDDPDQSGELNPGEFNRRPTDGRMITRVFTSDQSTIDDVTPEMGHALDTGTGRILDPLMWDPDLMIREQDPLEYGLVLGMDLKEVDAQVIKNNLVVKSELTLWGETEYDNYFEILLDTDVNVSTGEYVVDKGNSAIGVDYKVIVMSKYFGASIGYYANLIRPDGKGEAHDAFLFAEPHKNRFTVTIPLESIGSPKEISFFVSTRRFQFGALLSERYDIAPSNPIKVSTSASGDSYGSDFD